MRPGAALVRLTNHDHNDRRCRPGWNILPPRRRFGTAVARGRRVLLLLAKLIVTVAVVSLAAFNVWWYWRETRPVQDLATVSQWLNEGRYAEAEVALREHRRRSPHDGEVMIMLARARAARGDLLGCARQLHQVPYWWPTKAESLYREGQAFLQLDRAKDAEQAWLELIKEDPLHPVDASLLSDAYRGLLRIYAIEDRWEDAYPIIWIAYDRSSGSKERLYWLTMRMRAELERVSPKESIIELRRYVAAAADDYEALHALARAEIALGDRPEAERHYQACLKMRPDYVRGWRDYLTLLEEQGELEPFLAVLRACPPSADTEPEIWYFRGVAGEKAGDWRMAASHFRKALDLNPFLAKCYYRLGMADERMGSQEQAVVHRRKSSEINAARREFPAAHADYFASRAPDNAGTIDPAAAAWRLAAICKILGWARAEEAWNRVADGP